MTKRYLHGIAAFKQQGAARASSSPAQQVQQIHTGSQVLSPVVDFSSSEKALAYVSNTALELVLHHHVLPSEITEAISKRLHQEARKLPKVEVLYNTSYGGGGYSKSFYDFIPVREKTESHKLLKTHPHMPPYMTEDPEQRIHDCGYIRPFGEQQATGFPIAFQVLVSYYDYNMEGHIRNMNTLAHASVCGASEIAAAQKACSDLPEELLQLHCSHKAEQFKVKSWQSPKEEDRDNFHQELKKLGEGDEKIWKAQDILDQNIMQCLHKWLRKGHRNPQAHLEMATKTFGLMCASGKYCSLTIEEVPQIVEWGIDEYDGQESVYLKPKEMDMD